ncbi:hypothetical protein AGMMS49959_13560 [Planctomycetales bacterium]|nr:hypothetical protein AGMMS49959_13560 [Planctomycetales bacterium]
MLRIDRWSRKAITVKIKKNVGKHIKISMAREIFKQRSLDYVAAARALGASRARVVFRHILPNALAPVLVGISFSIAGAIAMESGLSFLGIGVASPTATWGELLLEGRDSPLPNWWLSIFPGLAIFAAMTAYNLIGEGLRDAMDPRLRK